eukprot:3084024-Pyramimonas_sp.AAC.1
MDEVFRDWRVNGSAGELRVRRLKRYQRWSQFPNDHEAVLTAALGTSKSDQSIGVKRITEHKNIRQPTPWAKQYIEDMRYLANHGEEFKVWYGRRSSGT